MDALELLKTDHALVRQLAKTFEQAEAEDVKAETAGEIVANLKVHTTIEEEIFYPAVRAEASEAEDIVLEGIEEHHVARQLIEEIEGLRPSDEAWEPKVTVLIESVEHHVGEEEDEMFPKVADALGAVRLEEIGRRLAARKQELAYEAMTRDDLYALAREREIGGRSDMTKAEIVAALTAADASLVGS